MEKSAIRIVHIVFLPFPRSDPLLTPTGIWSGKDRAAQSRGIMRPTAFLVIRELFSNVLDMDRDQRPVMRKMADYYLRDRESAFRFRAYPLGFDLLPSGDFAEVLVPESVYDIIDYHVRECVKRGVRMRVCKNCGRYFAVTGHGGVEYCDRVCDKKGRTCREVGAIMAWTKRRGEDDIFKAYRREYKKRFEFLEWRGKGAE